MLLQLENDSFDIPGNRTGASNHSARQFLHEGSTKLTQHFRDCPWRAIAPMLPGTPCYLTAEPEAVFTHNESWEKEKPPLPCKAFQEQAFDSSLCLWGRRGGSPRSSITCCPGQCSYMREAQGPWLLHALIPGELLLVLERTPGTHLFSHRDPNLFPVSPRLSSAQMSTMSTRAERWSSEAASASLVALRSCCKCLSLSDSAGLCSSSRTSCPF